MEKQINLITKFCNNANYYMVKYSSKPEEEMGKILKNEELSTVDLEKNEIYRSINFVNNDVLLVVDLKNDNTRYVNNQFQMFHDTLEYARIIELVYPNIFTWAFNGLNVVGYALVPSGNLVSHPTISRYGGTINFVKILRQHLKNIVKMKIGDRPDNNFLDEKDEICDTELSIGSINKKTDLYSVPINISDSFISILNNSTKCFYDNDFFFHYLDMKYWTKEINPDFIEEAKHIKLKSPIPYTEEVFKIYPIFIKRLMELPTKGNYNRHLLARFLLSIHSVQDAKFIYYSVLGDEELDHVKNGDCGSQWTYICNNIDRYPCPTMRELSAFIREGDEKLNHPLEKICGIEKKDE